MKTRKLLHQRDMQEFHELRELGVPLSKIIRDNKLVISNPHFTKLLDYYKDYLTADLETCELIGNSLFPDWLQDEPIVQEQPETYSYKGKFPLGEWQEQVVSEAKQ